MYWVNCSFNICFNMGLTDLDLSPLSHLETCALSAAVNGWSQGWWLRVVALRVPANLLIQLLTAANNAGSQAPRISALAKCHCDGLVSCECACVAAVSRPSNIKSVLDFDDPGVERKKSQISTVPPPLPHSFTCLSVTSQPRPTAKFWNWALRSYCAWWVGRHLCVFRPF